RACRSAHAASSTDAPPPSSTFTRTRSASSPISARPRTGSASPSTPPHNAGASWGGYARRSASPISDRRVRHRGRRPRADPAGDRPFGPARGAGCPRLVLCSGAMPPVADFIATWGYTAIFLIVVSGNIGIPVPEETILTLGGYLAWRGQLRFSIVVLVGMVSA